MMAMNKIGLALAAMAGAVLAVSGPAHAGSELLVNGDFSAGNTGFSSDYTQSSNLYPEGNYDVTSNPQADHNLFSMFGDHTTGTGLMMVLNGAPPPVGAVAWSETVNVAAGANYDFSAWVASVYPASPSDLAFSINGDSLGTFTASSTTGNWQNFAASWNSGLATTANVQIVDLNTEPSGNDFALDDLSLQGQAPVPEASTTVSFGLLLVLGLGGVVVAAKRKKVQSSP